MKNAKDVLEKSFVVCKDIKDKEDCLNRLEIFAWVLDDLDPNILYNCIAIMNSYINKEKELAYVANKEKKQLEGILEKVESDINERDKVIAELEQKLEEYVLANENLNSELIELNKKYEGKCSAEKKLQEKLEETQQAFDDFKYLVDNSQNEEGYTVLKLYSKEKNVFRDEQLGMVLDVLSKVPCVESSRRQDVIESIVENTVSEYNPTKLGNDINREITAMSGSVDNFARLPILKDHKMVYDKNSKHKELTYNKDDRYSIGLASTASDKNWKKVVIREIKNRFL